MSGSWGNTANGKVAGASSASGGWGKTANGPVSGSIAAQHKKHHRGGVLGGLEKVAQPVANLSKDIESAAVGVGPGLYKVANSTVVPTAKELYFTATGNEKAAKKQQQNLRSGTKQLGSGVVSQYKDYYGHDVLQHLYDHPLQPLLDALTVATGGAGAAAKAGKVAADAGAISDTSKLAQLGERGTVVTRSPLKVATGEGPAKEELTATSPLVKLRELAAAERRSSGKLFGSAKLAERKGGRIERRGGELAHYGKLIQQEASRAAYSRGQALVPYAKAVKGLSGNEWTALHLRAMDIHPDDLTILWKDKPGAENVLTPDVRKLVVEPSAKMKAAEPALRALSKHGETLFRKAGKLKEDTAAARPGLTKTQAAEQLGRPVRQVTGDPYYFPHVPEPGKSPSPLRMEGGGKGVPRTPSSLKQNTGYLALQGKLHLRSDVLGPDFARRVKFVKYDEIHNALTRGAVPWTRQQLAENGGLPKGWEYIRRKASEKTPVEARAQGAHVPVNQLIPNAEDLHDSGLAEGFSTTDSAHAATDAKGRYLIAPSSTIKAATGEFTRSSAFVHYMNRYPLRVWRAAVLGLRPGFLTNNLVGNSIMYAAKTGGKGALRDLFGAIKESRGEKVARELLDNHATPPGLRRDLYAEFFPEQTHGTFGLTQSPATATTVGKAAHTSGRVFNTITGALPKLTSKVAEEYPRRALIRHYLRTSPEFKTIYKGLPHQTRSFETAARQLLESDKGPQFQAYVSKQVNQALGDYLHLPPFQRNVLRNIAPFYAWYRAIVTTTYHLAADTPLRANILGQIGQIGKQWSDQQLGEIPSFLEGAIPLGHGSNGTRKVLATQGLNPYATLFQLGHGTSDLSALGINPFAQALLDQYAQAKQHGGNVSPLALAASALSGIVTGLPPAQLVAPLKPSKLYPNRNRNTTLEQFFGVPLKEYRPAQAAADKRKGY